MTPIRERMGITLLVAYLSTGFGQVLNQAFFFLLLRYLPVQGVGAYSWAVAVATIYTYVMDLGLAVFLMGELSKTHYRLRAVIQLVLCLRAPPAVLGVAGLMVWSWFAQPPAEEFWALALIALAYVIQLIDVGLIPWFQIHQRQNTANLVAIIVPLGRLVGIALPLLAGHALRLPMVVAVLLVTQVAGTASLFYLAKRADDDEPSGLEVSPNANLGQLLRRYWARGPGLAVMYSLNILQARLDWILVSALISKVALANYSLANKVIELAMLIASIWARTSFPWHAQKDSDEPGVRTRLILLRHLFIVSSAGLMVILFFWTIPLVHVFFGNKYAGAEISIRLMTLGTSVFMLNQFLFYMILGLKQEKPYTILIFAVTLAQVLIDCLLLPRIGISGAAVGMLVVGAGMHAGQVLLLKRQKVLEGNEILCLELFLGGVIGSLLLAWWVSAGLVTGTCLSLLLAAALGFSLILRVDDRAQISEWIARHCASRSAAPGA